MGKATEGKKIAQRRPDPVGTGAAHRDLRRKTKRGHEVSCPYGSQSEGGGRRGVAWDGPVSRGRDAAYR